MAADTTTRTTFDLLNADLDGGTITRPAGTHTSLVVSLTMEGINADVFISDYEANGTDPSTGFNLQLNDGTNTVDPVQFFYIPSSEGVTDCATFFWVFDDTAINSTLDWTQGNTVTVDLIRTAAPGTEHSWCADFITGGDTSSTPARGHAYIYSPAGTSHGSITYATGTVAAQVDDLAIIRGVVDSKNRELEQAGGVIDNTTDFYADSASACHAWGKGIVATAGNVSGSLDLEGPSFTNEVAVGMVVMKAPPSDDRAGDISGAVPTSGGAAAGTHTSNDRTGTASGAVPTSGGSASGTYTSPPIVGTISGAVPPIGGAAAGTHTIPSVAGDASGAVPTSGGAAAGTHTPPVVQGGISGAVASVLGSATGTFTESATYDLFPTDPANSGGGNDEQGITLGVVFTSTQAGQVTHIKFRHYTGGPATVDVGLWRLSDGALLGSATGQAATADAWNTIALSASVSIAADTEYVAGYWNGTGTYSIVTAAFPMSEGPLLAPAAPTVGARNGRFLYDASMGMPTSTYSDSNYAVTPVLQVGAAAPNNQGGITGAVSAIAGAASGTYTPETATLDIDLEPEPGWYVFEYDGVAQGTDGIWPGTPAVGDQLRFEIVGSDGTTLSSLSSDWVPTFTGGSGASSEHEIQYWNGSAWQTASVYTYSPGAITGNAAGAVPTSGGSAAGTHVPPVFSGAAAGAVPTSGGTATGTHAPPVFSGAAAGAVSPVSGAGSGTTTAPVVAGDAAGAVQTSGGAATGTHTPPVVSGDASGAVPTASGSSAGTHTHPVISGSASGSVKSLAGSAAGVVTAPVIAGVIAGALAACGGAAEGTHTPPVFSGDATGAVPALSGAASGAYTDPAAIVGNASGAVPVISGAASGTHDPPITGDVSGAVAALGGSADGTFTPLPVFSGDASGAVQALGGAAAGTFSEAPPDTATIDIDLEPEPGFHVFEFDGVAQGPNGIWPGGVATGDQLRFQITGAPQGGGAATVLVGMSSDWQPVFSGGTPGQQTNHEIQHWSGSWGTPGAYELTVPPLQADASGAIQAVSGSAAGAFLPPGVTGDASGAIQALGGSASGAYLPPGISGNASGAVPTSSGSAAGTHVPPVFAGDAAGAVPSTGGSAAGTHTPPVFAGDASGSVPALGGAATGQLLELFSGTISGAVQAIGGASSGTHTPPVFAGSAAGAVSAVGGSASGVQIIPGAQGEISGAISPVSGSAAGIHNPTPDEYSVTAYLLPKNGWEVFTLIGVPAYGSVAWDVGEPGDQVHAVSSTFPGGYPIDYDQDGYAEFFPGSDITTQYIRRQVLDVSAGEWTEESDIEVILSWRDADIEAVVQPIRGDLTGTHTPPTISGAAAGAVPTASGAAAGTSGISMSPQDAEAQADADDVLLGGTSVDMVVAQADATLDADGVAILKGGFEGDIDDPGLKSATVERAFLLLNRKGLKSITKERAIKLNI